MPVRDLRNQQRPPPRYEKPSTREGYNTPPRKAQEACTRHFWFCNFASTKSEAENRRSPKPGLSSSSKFLEVALNTSPGVASFWLSPVGITTPKKKNSNVNPPLLNPTTKGKEQFCCTLCDKNFKIAFSLKRHMAVHNAPKFQCEQCDKTYKTKEKFKRHKVVHSGKRPYKCKICNKFFKRKDKVQRHARTVHKNKAEQDIKCVSITSHASESPNVNVRKLIGDEETPEMKADFGASVYHTAVNQLQWEGSAPEFVELPKIPSGIGNQNFSSAVNVDSSLTGDQKEYLTAIFNANDSVATSECKV
ncbi:unnamed protein product [Orchesella dallaii]|uniref:C2H2-type domain-containing protein n=1 Tax=Orchesella dallaii TaxID=48710 RepID=A0ABP1S2B4_9HEXA